jgi:hypothetical protein
VALIKMRVAFTPGTGNRKILGAEIVGRGDDIRSALKTYLVTRTNDGDLTNVPIGKTEVTVFVSEKVMPDQSIERTISPIGVEMYKEIRAEIAKDDSNQRSLHELANKDSNFRALLSDFQKKDTHWVRNNLDWTGTNTTFEVVRVGYNAKTKEYVFLWSMDLGRGNSEEAALAQAAQGRVLGEHFGKGPPPGFELMKFYMFGKIDASRQITWKTVDFPATSWPTALATVPKYESEIAAQSVAYEAKFQSTFRAAQPPVPQQQSGPRRSRPMRGPNGETITPPQGSGVGSGDAGKTGRCGADVCIGSPAPTR